MARTTPDVTELTPTSPAEAQLLERYPINKPHNPHRNFERRANGQIVEIVPEAAAVAIRAFLDGEDVAIVDEVSSDSE